MEEKNLLISQLLNINWEDVFTEEKKYIISMEIEKTIVIKIL